MKISFQILAYFLCIAFLKCETPIILQPSIEQYHSFPNYIGPFIKYFNITIPKKIEGADLVIMTRPLEDINDPDLYISESNEYPDSYSNSDMICSSNGLDVCTIPDSSITDNKTFYLSIKCYSQCSFAMKATYAIEDFFILQESPENDTLLATHNLKFDSNEAKVVRFFIPENVKNFQRILVKVQQTKPNKVNESFSFYMNEGQNIPTTSRHLFKGMEAWNSGKCVLITNTSFEFWSTTSFGNFQNSNINYTLLIQAPANSALQVKVQAYNELMKVKIHQNLQDMVYQGEKITYELEIDKNYSLTTIRMNNLLFTLTAFSGNPDIYVNPDTLPTNISDYKWKSIESGRETLIITSYERLVARATDFKYYITIYGVLTSAFSLWVGTTKTTNYLTFGVTQTGLIANGEIINYRFFVESDEDMNITATLATESGNPDLYVKMCILSVSNSNWKTSNAERLKCMVNDIDISGRNKKKPNFGEFLLYSDNVAGKDALTFKHEVEKCRTQSNNDSSEHKCMYMVAVYGNCQWANESQFSLLVTHSQEHVILREANPQRNKGDLNSMSYYKFTLLEDKEVESIKFLMTEISGTVDTYVSKKTRYPGINDYEKFSYSNWGNLTYDLNDIKTRNEKSLAGTYYIGVYSETASTSSILTIVKRKAINNNSSNVIPQFQSIQLSTGVPQYYSFVNDPLEKHYFKTSVLDSDIVIHLTPIRGEFTLYVLNTPKSNLSYPTNKNYHFMLGSNENTLIIRNTSKNWTRRSRYMILVESIVDSQGGDYQLYEFIIQYSTTDSMKVISSHNPLRESVTNDTFSYYRCEVHKGDESIEISINVHSFNPYDQDMLEVFFTFTSDNPFPDENNNEFSFIIQNNKWILIENTQLKTNCPWLFQESPDYTKQCVFYMSIRAFEADAPEIVYSINMKRNFIQKTDSLIFDFLTDNAPKSINYNAQNPEPLYFLYKLEKTKRPLHISAFTQDFYGANFAFMANFHPLANLTQSSLANYFPKIFQSAVLFVVDSEWHHSISFTIYKDFFNSLPCLEMDGGCGLFISIFLRRMI